MTEREAIEAILEQWKTGWQTLHPGSANDSDDALDISEPLCVPWTTGNEAFTTDALGALGAWARVSVRHTTAEQSTHGSAPSRKFERRGSVMVQLFAPADAGVGLLADLAEDVRTVLEGQRLGELVTYAGRTEEVPSDGAWAMAVVIVEFRYTRTR